MTHSQEQNGMKFTSRDQDNDTHSGNCAQYYDVMVDFGIVIAVD